MLRLALQPGSSLPRRVAFRRGASWEDMESKSQTKVSFTANCRHCCVSLAVLRFMCSPNGDDSHYPGLRRRVSVDHDSAAPGQVESLGRNHFKCKQDVSKCLQSPPCWGNWHEPHLHSMNYSALRVGKASLRLKCLIICLFSS